MEQHINAVLKHSVLSPYYKLSYVEKLADRITLALVHSEMRFGFDHIERFFMHVKHKFQMEQMEEAMAEAEAKSETANSTKKFTGKT